MRYLIDTDWVVHALHCVERVAQAFRALARSAYGLGVNWRVPLPPNGYERIQRLHSPALGQYRERVDVQFGDCAFQAGGHVGYTDQGVGQRFDVGSGSASEALQQAAAADLGNHLAGV